jgi:hypothetical protein
MPCNYRIERKQRLVISTAWGVLTGEEILEHQNRLVCDSCFNSDFYQLLELVDVTNFEIDFDTMDTLSEQQIFSPRSRRAFIAKSPLAFGLSRMFASLRELRGGEEQIRIFDNRDEALGWLLGTLGGSLKNGSREEVQRRLS